MFNTKKYLEYEGRMCPFCDSTILDADHMDFEDNYGWRSVICQDCKEIWVETYTLTDAHSFNV